MKSCWKSGLAAAAALSLLLCPTVAWANVYATGLSAQVSAVDPACGTHQTAKITYVLNENADDGVTIEVLTDPGNTVVRTVQIARQLKGTNTFEWDGRDDSGARVSGNFKVRITAADGGHTQWTRLDPDNEDTSFYVPVGVAVNRNPASPYYGNIYVSNCVAGIPAGRTRSSIDGFYRLSADCTTINSGTGGQTWSGGSSPFKIAIGEDDRVYVADLSNDLAFDMAPDLSSSVQLIDASNRSSAQWVGSIVVEGNQADGNRKIYLVNVNYEPARRGLIQYNLGAAAAAATGDLGTQYIGPSYYSYYPYDFVRDSNGDWYGTQYRYDPTQAEAIAKFLDAAPPINTAHWKTPLIAPYNGGYCLDIYEPKGWVAYGNYYDGWVHIFNMSDGSYVAGFDAGSRIRDIAFDEVGNIYTVDNTVERLRIWSPPDGPNSKTTLSPSAFGMPSSSGGPVITAQPADASFCAGGNVSFTVTATGSSPTYQWKLNGTVLTDGVQASGPLAGATVANATTATLDITNVPSTANGRTVTAVVCDANGVAVSEPALLNIGANIIQPPGPKTVCVGGTATFTVLATGVTTLNPLSYQWEKDAPGDPVQYDPIPGATSDTLVLTGLTAGDNNSRVRVVVTDDCGSATSASALLTVRTGPSVNHVGYSNRALAVGGSHTLTCEATNITGEVHYQWYRTYNSVKTPVGTDQNSYRITNANCAQHDGIYSCAVTDDCGTTESSDPYGDDPVCEIIVGGGLPEQCGNGIDDDCDGLTDCEDSDCGNDPNCIPVCPHNPVFDSDDDNDIDHDDFGGYQACFTANVQITLSDECRCYDWDGNGFVDTGDLLKFVNCYSGPGVPLNPACDDYPTGDVVINEFAYDMLGADGLDATDDREFVEIYNRSGSPVDVSNWILRASDVAPPGDDDRDFMLPANTILQPGEFFVIGSGLVPNVDMIVSPAVDIWENNHTALQLIDRNGDVRDTVVYEACQGTPAVGFVEGRIWGPLEFATSTSMSVSRYQDGLDTGNNGRDFGLRPQTPGASNHASASTITAYVPPNIDGYIPGSDVDGLVGSFVNARVILPTSANTDNPNAIPVSPQGGNAIVAWDPSGGGNSAYSADLFIGDGSFDLWVYLDTSDITVAGAETTVYGIMGTIDTLMYTPDPGGTLFAATTANWNGCTGLAWVFQKDNAGNVKRLFLVDAGPGGNSTPDVSPMHWVVHQTIDMSTVPSGWYRLALSYTSATGAVSATFDTQTYNFTTATGLVGGFYVGYRESLAGQPTTLRPATFDLKP